MSSNLNRVTEVELERLRRGHAEGRTLSAICAEMGRPYKTMWFHAQEMKLIFPRGKRKTMSGDLKALKEGHKEGRPLAHISRDLGIPLSTLRLHAGLLGLRFKSGRPVLTGPVRTREQFEAERKVMLKVASIHGVRPTARAMGLEPAQVQQVMKRAGVKNPFGPGYNARSDPKDVAAAIGRAWLEMMGRRAA